MRISIRVLCRLSKYPWRFNKQTLQLVVTFSLVDNIFIFLHKTFLNTNNGRCTTWETQYFMVKDHGYGKQRLLHIWRLPNITDTEQDFANALALGLGIPVFCRPLTQLIRGYYRGFKYEHKHFICVTKLYNSICFLYIGSQAVNNVSCQSCLCLFNSNGEYLKPSTASSIIIFCSPLLDDKRALLLLIQSS